MVSMYDRILVPTDGSAGMDEVVEHAGDLALAHDATIRALYVIDAASFTSLPMETSWEGVSDLLQEEGQQALDDVERLTPDDVPVESAIVEGTPSREIVRHASQQDCDIVVMGTHGRGGLNRILLGSVAERVVRSADVPVLTVRVRPESGEQEAEASEAIDPDAPQRRVRDVEDSDREPTPEPGAR